MDEGRVHQVRITKPAILNLERVCVLPEDWHFVKNFLTLSSPVFSSCRY